MSEINEIGFNCNSTRETITLHCKEQLNHWPTPSVIPQTLTLSIFVMPTLTLQLISFVFFSLENMKFSFSACYLLYTSPIRRALSLKWKKKKNLAYLADLAKQNWFKRYKVGSSNTLPIFSFLLVLPPVLSHRSIIFTIPKILIIKL